MANGRALTLAQERATTRLAKNMQLLEALAFCEAEKCGAKTALARNIHRWPDLTYTIIDYAKKGRVKPQKEQAILTREERQDLVTQMEAAAAAGYHFGSNDRDSAILDMLNWRQTTNKKGGRKFVKLGRNALKVLRVRRVGRNFWRGFFAEFPQLRPNAPTVRSCIVVAK